MVLRGGAFSSERGTHVDGDSAPRQAGKSGRPMPDPALRFWSDMASVGVHTRRLLDVDISTMD